MKPNIMKKVKTALVISMLVVMIFIIVITTEIFDYMLSNQQKTEVNQLAQVVTNTIDNSINSEKVIESYLIRLIEIKLEEIVEIINELDESELTEEFLENLTKEYEVSGAALFHDEGDDIIIEKSTSKTEIGLSTANWGFWYDAFRQLFDDGEVSLDRGYADGPFWVGPRSLAYGQNGYYIFGYYKLPNKPYLLNVYVNDIEAFGLVRENDPNLLLKEITEKSSLIEEIAVINIEAWNARFSEEHRVKLQDFTIHYGKYTFFRPEDTYYFNKSKDLKSDENLSFDFYKNRVEYTKIFKKINNNSVMSFVINQNDRKSLKENMFYIIIGGLLFIGLMSFLIVTYFTNKYSDLLKIESARLITAEEFKNTVKILPSMIFRLKQIDLGIVIQHCEGSALSELNIDPEQSQNQLIELILPPKYLAAAWASIEEALLGKSTNFEYRQNDKIYTNMVKPMVNKDLNLDKELIIFANDVTELRNSEEQAKYMAYHDSLTNLPNRHYFKEIVEKNLKTIDDEFTIAFIDLDGFKNVNDTAGHDMGDELLKQVADRIKKYLTNEDFAARMGGDEFAILYHSASNNEDIIGRLIELNELLSKEYIIKNNNFKISASIGVSQYPIDGIDYITLLKKADIALYDVKYSGKNNFVFYTEKN